MPGRNAKRKRELRVSPRRNLRTKQPKHYGEQESAVDSLATSTSSSSQNEHWEAEILDERRVNRKEYLIKWAGLDPTTNKQYPAVWLPTAALSKALLDDWTERKDPDFVTPPSTLAERGRPTGFDSPPTPASASSTSEPVTSDRVAQAVISPALEVRPARRGRLVIPDSSQPSTAVDQTPVGKTGDNWALDSSWTSDPLSEPLQPKRQTLQVRVMQHSQSFYDRYETVSSFPATPVTAGSSSTKRHPEIRQTDSHVNYINLTPVRVIPDSEDSRFGKSISTQLPSSAIKAPAGSVSHNWRVRPCLAWLGGLWFAAKRG